MKYMSRPKRAAVKDIHVDIVDILVQKYRYRIDIGKGDIDPPLDPMPPNWYIFGSLGWTPWAITTKMRDVYYLICVHRHADVVM